MHSNIHGFYKNTFSLEFLNLQCEVKTVHLKKKNIVLRQDIVHKWIKGLKVILRKKAVNNFFENKTLILNFGTLGTIIRNQLIKIFYVYFMSILCSEYYDVHLEKEGLHSRKWQLRDA